MGYAGFVYDVYYAFGGEAAWVKKPGPLVPGGGPVLHEGDKLLAALRALL